MTPIEYNILLLLVKNPGKVFSIEQIYENIWNEEAIGADNTVAVHIRHPGKDRDQSQGAPVPEGGLGRRVTQRSTVRNLLSPAGEEC